HLYDITSEEPRFQGKSKARTTAAVLSRNGILWFVKMSGEESIVAQQQEAFRDFLKSMSFHEEEHEPAVASAAPADSEGPNVSNWKFPASWQAKPAGQMQLAVYTAKNNAGASADITVSSFPGAV